MSVTNFIVLSRGPVTKKDILEQIDKSVGTQLTGNKECHICCEVTKEAVMGADNLHFVESAGDKIKIRKVF